MSQDMIVHLQVKLVQLERHLQHASLQDSMRLVEDMLRLVLMLPFASLLQMLEVRYTLLPLNLLVALTSASNIQAQVKDISLYNKIDIIPRTVQEIMLTEHFQPRN
jgi:hypothetical protein